MGNEFSSINNMIDNTSYKNTVKDEVKKLMGNKNSISVKEAVSIFSKYNKSLSPDILNDKIANIANKDGDANVNATEMSAIYTLLDMELNEQNKFQFDGKISTDAEPKFGLAEATEGEIKIIMDAYKTEEELLADKKMYKINKTDFDLTKPIEDRLTNSNVDEVMLAMQDILPKYVDKTGKSLTIPQIVTLFLQYCSNNDGKTYEEIAENFTNETGIPISNFERCRCLGDGDSFTIGDGDDCWEYSEGTITNTKTGEVIKGLRSEWANSASNTVPAENGYVFMLTNYNDNKGTVVQFSYEDPENVAPTGAEISIDGKTTSIEYPRKETIDPELYNFYAR